MYNYEIDQNKLFIVLEYGELDFQKYLHKNKGNIDNETLRYFWRQVMSRGYICANKDFRWSMQSVLYIQRGSFIEI